MVSNRRPTVLLHSAGNLKPTPGMAAGWRAPYLGVERIRGGTFAGCNIFSRRLDVRSNQAKEARHPDRNDYTLIKT